MRRGRLPLAGAAALLALVAWGQHAHASTLHRAALLMEHGNGSLIARCVSFVEDQITGLQLIQRSGLEYQAQQFGSLGSAICQLDNEPSPAPPGCFGSGPSWQYFHRTASGWVPSAAGASSSAVHDGDMDGWRYAAGGNQSPVLVTFDAVCRPAAPTAVASNPSAHPAAAPPSSAAVRAAPSAPAPTALPSATASSAGGMVALAPNASVSPRVALALTNGTHAAASPGPNASWLLLGGGGVLLLTLLLVNLRRGGP